MSQEQQPSPPSAPPSPYYATPFTSSRKYEERDYEEIYYHFEDYSQDIILANASKFMTPPEPAEHYEWEEVILDEASEPEWQGMKKSMFFGMGCGLLSFGLLRWRRVGRSPGGSTFGGLSKYASTSSTSSSRSSSGGYTFDALPPKSNNTLHQHHHHQYNNNNTRSGLIFDVVLTTVIGFGTSLLALESDAFHPTTTITTSGNTADTKAVVIPHPPQWISPNLPLVPGRSIVSETLCGPLTEEFRKFPKQLWQSGNNRGIENGYNNHMALYANSGWKGTKYYGDNANASVVSLGENGSIDGNNNNPQQGTYEHLLLDSLQGFVINCERRARHERKLRKIRGLREGSSVVIPEGGVTANEDLELDDIYLIDQEDEGDDDDASHESGLGL